MKTRERGVNPALQAVPRFDGRQVPAHGRDGVWRGVDPALPHGGQP